MIEPKEEESRAANIPVGFRFYPTEEELILDYLYNKVHGNPLPCDEAVKECNLYGEIELWEIWDKFGGPTLKGDQNIYFFTQLKRKSANDSRFVRKIGAIGGAWKGEDSAKHVKDQSCKKRIAIKKRFRYENSGTSHDGNWVMHEFTLDQSLLFHNSQDNDYVIARIKKKNASFVRKRTRQEKGDQENAIDIIANDHNNKSMSLEVEKGSPRDDVVALNQRKYGAVNTNYLHLTPTTTTKKVVSKGKPPLPLVAEGTTQQPISLETDYDDEDENEVEDEDEDDEDEDGRGAKWIETFARELLQGQPPENLKEKEIEMLPNHYYSENWTGYELLVLPKETGARASTSSSKQASNNLSSRGTSSS